MEFTKLVTEIARFSPSPFNCEVTNYKITKSFGSLILRVL